MRVISPVWIDTGDIDHNDELRRIVRAEAVRRRAETAAKPRYPRDLPEVREELLDLALQAAEITATRHVRRGSLPLE